MFYDSKNQIVLLMQYTFMKLLEQLFRSNYLQSVWYQYCCKKNSQKTNLQNFERTNKATVSKLSKQTNTHHRNNTHIPDLQNTLSIARYRFQNLHGLENRPDSKPKNSLRGEMVIAFDF